MYPTFLTRSGSKRSQSANGTTRARLSLLQLEERAVPAAALALTKLTNGTDNNAAPGVFVPVGSTVTFTYVVTNPGDTPVAGVAVVDDNGTPGNPADDFNATFVGGDTNSDNLLDTTETWTYTATRVATAGQYTNTATVTGTDSVSTAPLTASDLDNSFGASPAINVVKLTNGTDNNAAPGVFVPVGSTETFTYVVTNPGNVPLSGVAVVDDNGTPGTPGDDFNATFVGGDTNSNGLLDLGETWTYTATRVATAGQYTNTATATGTPPAGAGGPVTDTDVDNSFGSTPAINIVKQTNGTDNNAAPGVFVPVGSTVTFTYTVTNPGNVPLSAVSLIDDNGTPADTSDDVTPTFVGGDTNTDGLLDPGETWTYTATRVATAGQYTNTATVTGTPPAGAGPAVTASDTDNHFGASAAISVVKLTNGTDNNAAPGVFVPVGSTVTFTYRVTNPGNVALSAVGVRDNNGTAGTADDFSATFVGGDTNTNGQLDPGETWTFTATRTATAGQDTNTATATGTPPVGAGPAATATATDNHFGATPGIRIVKLTNGTDHNAGPGPVVPVGSTVTFTYQVTNTGNVSLSGVAVTDDRGLAPAFGGGDANSNGQLDPGETWTYTASTAATAGQYTNTGTVTGTPPTGAGPAVTASDSDHFFGVRTFIAVGAGPGDVRTGPHVKLFATDGTLIRSFYAYGADFHGGVTVAAADVNGDGVDDLVTGTASGADHVKVFDGVGGGLLASFLAFGGFDGGVTIAADGGRIVVGAGPGADPHVKVFQFANGALQEVASFLAFDAAFHGGVRVGLDEGSNRLVVGAGAGGPPHIKVYDATTFALVGSFLAFGPAYTGGVWVAAGGGVILVGAGVGGGTHLKEYDGDTLAEQASFLAAGAPNADQARVGVAAGAAEPLLLLTGVGPATSPRVGVYSAAGSLETNFDAFASEFLGGIFVG